MAESYETTTRWKEYQKFFPAELRWEDTPPAEEWWPWEGMRIHLDRYASKTARIKLIVLHGVGGYGRMLAPWALSAHRGDVETVAPDLPGYGLTETNGRAVDYPTWIACASALVEAERKRDGRPIVLFGGSVGGMLAYAVAANTRAAGLIATCFVEPGRADVRREVARTPLLGGTIPILLPVLRAFDWLKIPIRWIANMGAVSNDPALSALCASDPCGGGTKVSLRFMRTYLEYTPSPAPEDFRVCPVLLVHPGADTWTPLALTKPFYDRLASPKELVLLDNCGHFPVEEPGAGQMLRAIDAFLLAAASSGEVR